LLQADPQLSPPGARTEAGGAADRRSDGGTVGWSVLPSGAGGDDLSATGTLPSVHFVSAGFNGAGATGGEVGATP
jgi:hypothetical protein